MVMATSHSTVVKFSQISNENPTILSLCNLPINAAIFAFLLSVFEKPMPCRKTELFKYFVLNLLMWHITEQGISVEYLEDFDDLEEFEGLALAFQQLCHLAWSGILDCKTILTRQDIKRAGINPKQLNGLGLLQNKPSLSAIGWSAQYTFLHQCVQKFLAAFHVSKLPPCEQTAGAIQLIERNPFASVLPFLVGITKNPSVVQSLCDVLKNFSPNKVLQYLSSEVTHIKSAEIVLQLFSCVYESQSPDCCGIVSNSLQYMNVFFCISQIH